MTGQKKKTQHFLKNINISDFQSHIWNHYEKCIQKSTNMPRIGLVMYEIGFDILRNKNSFVFKLKAMHACQALMFEYKTGVH